VSAISTIDTLAHTSHWARHHIGDKLMWAGGLVVTALVVPAWPGAVLVGACVVGSCVSAHIPLRDLFVVLRVPFGFIVTGAMATALTVDVRNGWSIGIGPLGDAATLAGRSAAGTASAALLAMTVPMSELLARARRIGVPAVACEIALLMYRMIAVGLHRLRWQRLSQESRLGYRGFNRSLRSAAALAVSSFVGSMSHAQRLTVGLGARNFDGTLRVLHDAGPHSVRFVIVSSAALAAVFLISFAMVPR
jgi:cobalt/nickel transport system permease protein